MQVTEQAIRDVVGQVLAQMGHSDSAVPAVTEAVTSCNCPEQREQHCQCDDKKAEGVYTGRYGLFTDVDEAVAAATHAFEQLSMHSMEDRKQIIGHIRRISIEQCEELGTMEMQETKIGRLEHKIEKLKTLGEKRCWQRKV